jgi:outer membrane biosynthesis protein TonB
MRRMQRIVLLTTILAIMPVLAGCSTFDPESLDIFGLTDKKKLPGDRKPVFPEGVPGVTQGVPTQYIKGNQPPPEAAVVPPPEAAPPPVEEPKPKPKRKVAAKPKPVNAAPVQPVSQEPPQQQAQPQQQASPQQAWPQGSAPPPSGGTAAWPAPQPSGTFSR